MDRQQLLGLYSSRPSVISIVSGIKERNPHKIHLTGLIGSSRSVILSAVALSGEQSHVIVMNDSEEAAYLLNDIENLLVDQPVHYFPSSYKKPFETNDSDN